MLLVSDFSSLYFNPALSPTSPSKKINHNSPRSLSYRLGSYPGTSVRFLIVRRRCTSRNDTSMHFKHHFLAAIPIISQHQSLKAVRKLCVIHLHSINLIRNHRTAGRVHDAILLQRLPSRNEQSFQPLLPSTPAAIVVVVAPPPPPPPSSLFFFVRFFSCLCDGVCVCVCSR